MPALHALCAYVSHQQMSYRTFDQIQFNHFCVTQQSHNKSLVAVLPDLQDYSSHESMQNRESLVNIQKTSYTEVLQKRWELQVHAISVWRYPYFSIVLPAPINEFFEGKWAHYNITTTFNLPCHSDNLDFNIQLKGLNRTTLSRRFLYSWMVLHN